MGLAMLHARIMTLGEVKLPEVTTECTMPYALTEICPTLSDLYHTEDRLFYDICRDKGAKSGESPFPPVFSLSSACSPNLQFPETIPSHSSLTQHVNTVLLSRMTLRPKENHLIQLYQSSNWLK